MRKILRSVEEHVDETELWMLPYSTFMLMLVILFIAFYGYSTTNSIEYESALADLASTKTTGPAADIMRKEIEMTKSMKEFLKKSGMEDQSELHISAQFVKLKMESPALFDSGSAELKPDGTKILEHMRDSLLKMDNLIIVEGHTDNVPMHSQLYNSNWELSTARAFSVIRYFIHSGIVPKRLVAHGFGEYRPIFSNDTEQGRARNRRIEITIVRGSRSA